MIKDRKTAQAPKSWPLLAAMALFALLLLGACTQPADSGPNAAKAASDKEPEVATANHQLPADFRVTVYQGSETLGGEVLQFSDLLAQGKPIVLNAWAGLCPPCRQEMPDFEAVYQEFGDQVLFFGLDVGPFTSLGTSEDGRVCWKS